MLTYFNKHIMNLNDYIIHAFSAIDDFIKKKFYKKITIK
jgi:hypothetical protein